MLHLKLRPIATILRPWETKLRTALMLDKHVSSEMSAKSWDDNEDTVMVVETNAPNSHMDPKPKPEPRSSSMLRNSSAKTAAQGTRSDAPGNDTQPSNPQIQRRKRKVQDGFLPSMPPNFYKSELGSSSSIKVNNRESQQGHQLTHYNKWPTNATSQKHNQMRDHNNIGARLTLSATPNHDDLKAKYLRSMPERDDDEGNSDEELNRRPKTSRGRTPDNPLPKFGNHETINGEETFSHSRASDVGFVPELSRPTKLAKAMKPKMPSSNHDRQYPPSAYSSSTGSHRPSSSSTKPGLGTRSTPTVPFTASRGERRRTLFESGTHSRNDQPISDDDDDEDDSQLSSKWNPGVNASTVASGTRSVAVSANVHGKKNNDRDQDRDHEHQLRHGRQMSPTTSQPLSRDPQPSQQEFLFELTCDLKEISFGQKRFTGDKILLETIASDAKLFFRIGPKKYELFHKDIMNFQYYTSGSPPIGFLLYMKETFTIPEFREYYNPGSGNQLQKLQKVIVAIVESPKRTFDNLIGFVKHGPIIVTRLERDDWTYWLDLLETENKPPSLLEETRSQLLRRQHENNDSSRDNSASNAPLERSDVVAFESHAALYKTTRSQSPPQRETKSSHASPLLSDRTILVYPFKGVGAVTMTEEDISRLDDGEFLNDNIIEFYLKWYFDQLKMKNLELANKVHIFNSFFYKRLTQKAKSNKTENNYDRVKKWTSKVDLFRKRYIFMPVNESLHWYLVLICNPNLMLPLSSQNNPIDVDAEAAVSSTTMAESSNTSAILGDDSPIMEELQNEMEIDTASIGPDDMDVDEDHLPRAGFVQVFDQVCIPVISRNRKSKKQANGNSPADQSQQIVIDDLQAEERDEEHNLPLAKYSGVTADRNPAEPSSMVVESLPSVPKGPLFGEDDEDLELPTVAKVMGKPSKIKSRAGSPPLPSTLKKRVVKEDSSKKPHIIIFDSLGSRHPNLFKIITSYLQSEAHEKLNIDIDPNFKPIGMYAKVPNQTNHCDCGVFLLHYVEKFLDDPEKYLQLVLNKDDDKQAWSYGEIHSKRENIQKLIRDTAKAWRNSDEK